MKESPSKKAEAVETVEPGGNDSGEIEENSSESDKSDLSDSQVSTSENLVATEEEKTLSDYSSQDIEHARIWLQLGANKEIDELNVLHIPAGEGLNTEDETSAAFPEEVTQLTGSRLVDGVVTYSGNGDGTINIYNIPHRWDGNYPTGEGFYNEIIDNTDQVYIEPGDAQEIMQFIDHYLGI